MMVICGNSVEELEEGLDALKQTLRAGATCGVGGSSLEEVEKGMALMKKMMNEVESVEEEEEVISNMARQMIETLLRGT